MRQQGLNSLSPNPHLTTVPPSLHQHTCNDYITLSGLRYLTYVAGGNSLFITAWNRNPPPSSSPQGVDPVMQHRWQGTPMEHILYCPIMLPLNKMYPSSKSQGTCIKMTSEQRFFKRRSMINYYFQTVQYNLTWQDYTNCIFITCQVPKYIACSGS